MSVLDTGRKMTHTAVNTDPLHLTSSNTSERKSSYYALKERKIPQIRVADSNELHLWYEFGDKLGEGSFGIVLTVTEKNTSKSWAMKTVSKSTTEGHKLKMVEREIQILKMIQHPHIIYLDRVFESPKKIYMIFERCCGELTKLYNEHKPFVENIARIIIRQLADAMAYLHKHDIVHRDVKMENILMGKNPADPQDEYYIKLTDFGLSIVKCGKGIDSMLHDYCGTLFYMAPEIVTVRSYSQQCDMWAVGVLLYMLITGKYPFHANNEKKLQELICSKDPEFADVKPTSEAIDLILLLLTKNPANRITATEMLSHPWMLNRKMSKAMQYNILQMMKDWKHEMRVPAGRESDWVSVHENDAENTAVPGKQPLNLPKTNINFERHRRGSVDPRQVDNGTDRRASLNNNTGRRTSTRLSNTPEFTKLGNQKYPNLKN